MSLLLRPTFPGAREPTLRLLAIVSRTTFRWEAHQLVVVKGHESVPTLLPLLYRDEGIASPPDAASTGPLEGRGTRVNCSAIASVER